MKILCLSNGHGEDAIALRILSELKALRQPPELWALPIVGNGQAYIKSNIPIVGPTRQMPSGGFIYMDSRQLWQDLQGGLLQLTIIQWQTVKNWATQGDLILAVGDIVPLLFAWLSGLPYVFIGTAKSEYYLRNETGLLKRKSWLENFESWSGSVYLPWERFLISRPNCLGVFPRDTLTSQVLSLYNIPTYDLGNPMMDDLAEVYHNFRDQPAPLTTTQLATKSSLMITLLPGSRSPEAYANWNIIAEAINQVIATFPDRSLIFFGAIAPGLSLDGFAQVLDRQGWQRDRLTRSQTQASSSQLPMINPQPIPPEILQFPITLTKGKATVLLNQQQFAEFLDQGDLAIAMAGTATEQFVGLGKPAIAMPGQGPQFNPKFAEAQSRLLGESLILVEKPEQVGQVIKDLLQDDQRLEAIRENGHKRMGEPGAAKRIAKQIIKLWELRP